MDIIEILKVIIYPLMIFLFLVFFTLLFRSQFRELLKKVIVKFKKGDTEFELTQQVIESKSEINNQITENSVSLPTPQDEIPKVLATDSKSPDELMEEMRKAILDGEFEKGEHLYNQLQEAARDPAEKGKREGVYYYYLYQRGNQSALQKIIELTKNPDVSHYAHYYLGLCYESGENFEQAFKEHELAVQNSKSQEKRAFYVVNCARSLHKNGKKQDAIRYITVEIAKTTDKEALSNLYSGIASLFYMEDNYELRGLALEKAIEQKPNDTSLLFEIAYAYSQIQHNELSLLYYSALLNFSPENAMALNNFGVAYSRLGMPINSIRHHKKGFDLGNSLAASNIALGYLGAGFADEATQIIEKAREQKEVHKNIGSTFSKISDNKEKEKKREKEVFENAREQQRFMRAFGEAYFVYQPNTIDISGVWCFSDDTEVTITQQNEAFSAEWVEHKMSNGFKGELLNRGARITMTPSRYREPAEEEVNRLYVSSDLKTINIMLKRYSRFEYKKLERKQNESSSPA